MSGFKGKANKIYLHSKKGYALCQQNGQRTYGGPPPNWGSRPPPSRDCEVFIGRLPRMCFEDELIPLFLTAGELYEFRLMLDFSGTNRGYGYAHYAKLEYAEKAIQTLNRYEIRPGHRIGVLKSKNNCRLLFGNIRSATNVEGFSDFIRKTTDEVLNVIMFKSFLELKQTDFRISEEVEAAFLARVARNNGNNQFAIVEYENHKAAAVARRILIPKYGHILAIDWAVPPRERTKIGPVNSGRYLSISHPQIEKLKEENFDDLNTLYPHVPVLVVRPSIMNKVPFMPDMFNNVLAYFKHLIRIYVNVYAWKMNISPQVSFEIRRKVVDRISNMENCAEAVHLILNYFSFLMKRKKILNNPEISNLLQEVKMYAESFVNFVWNKSLSFSVLDEITDNYYCKVLPLRLNLLFYIMLIFNSENPPNCLIGITKGLNWLKEFIQKGDKKSNMFLKELTRFVVESDPASFERAKSLAKLFCEEFMNTDGQYIDHDETFLSFAKNDDILRDKNSLSLSTKAPVANRLPFLGGDNAPKGNPDRGFRLF